MYDYGSGVQYAYVSPVCMVCSVPVATFVCDAAMSACDGNFIVVLYFASWIPGPSLVTHSLNNQTSRDGKGLGD